MSDTPPSEMIEVRRDDRTNMVHYIIPGEYLPPEMVEAIGKQIMREISESFDVAHTKVHDRVLQSPS